MGFIDNMLGKKDHNDQWDVTSRGVLRELTYDEIVSALGRPQKAVGGFVYWRKSLSSIDPDLSDEEYFQLSNKDFNGFRGGGRKASLDREYWFILATSEAAIRTAADETGGLARDIEQV